MSVVGKLAGRLTGGLVGEVGETLDKLFTSDDERLSRQEAIERLRQQPHLAQIDLNKIEAQHRHWFVAGWRPFFGWVGGIALAWQFVGYDLAAWAACAPLRSRLAWPGEVGR